MSCDDVREHLAEHVLDTLPPEQDAGVRGHLRGCMACRRELAALEEGMSTFARAAHQVDPPEPLRTRVLAVLEDERTESSNALRRKRWLRSWRQVSAFRRRHRPTTACRAGSSISPAPQKC